MQIAPDVYILCDGHAVYTNHSCDPNAGIKDLVKLVAVRPISKGEQIFFDYSTTMDEDHYTMQCKCGVATCRRVVTDFKLLSEERQLHYLKLGVVQPFIVTPVVQRKLEQLKDWYNNHTNGSGLAHG